MTNESSGDITFTSPLNLIESLYDENNGILKNLEDVEKYFRITLQNDTSKIPCINTDSLNNMKPNTLVRYRGMVQDMFDPEFYFGKFETINRTSKEKVERLGCYTDTYESQDEEIDFESPKNVTLERQTYFVVPVPGENQWLKNMYSKQSTTVQATPPKRTKRPLEEMDFENAPMHDDSTLNSGVGVQTEGCCEINTSSEILACGTEKKIKIDDAANIPETSGNKKTSTDFTNNFPLSDEKRLPCFMKMYSNRQNLKINDVADFVCILSVDPVLAAKSMSNAKNEENIMTWTGSNPAEEKAHCPPPSLVPRLHCLFFDKVTQLNPKFHTEGELRENVMKEMSSIRADIMQLFTKIFGGDSVVAEYLLFHLVSSVYGRVGAMCLGKFPLNIFKCPKSGFTKSLYSVLELLVEKSHYLPLTLKNLNSLKFVPRKDYDANRLVTGILQLPSGLNLVLDETKMENGKLDSDGLRNLTAIGNVIQWQKVDYDFQFSKVEMITDVNVLVLSEGKSMLQCDCQVPIVSDQACPDYEELISGFSTKVLEKVRMYLAIVKSAEYNLTDEIQQALQDDFVEMRKTDPKTNADLFYTLLTTARYMALSYGQTTLSSSLWTRTKELDAERRNRMT